MCIANDPLPDPPKVSPKWITRSRNTLRRREKDHIDAKNYMNYKAEGEFRLQCHTIMVWFSMSRWRVGSVCV